jgi:hypothetical protein
MNHAATDHGRRKLLMALGAGGLSAAAVASPALQLAALPAGGAGDSTWWNRMFFSLRNGGAGEWSSVVGQVFSIESEIGSVPTLLGGVKPFRSPGLRPGECSRAKAFGVWFNTAPDRAPEGDRTYRLTHPTYPPLDIFLSAGVKMPRGVRFEAVFN